jgi:hypothetical protein
VRSLLVEFHRFNDLETGIWRKGDPYLAAAASHPVREFKMPLGQDDFLDLIVDLRYQSSGDKRKGALKRVGEIATEFLGSDSLREVNEPADDRFPLQLDLVVNPMELSALPFEAATDSQGRALLARAERPVVLTRRVRHGFADNRTPWPARPRMLYAWAAPSGVEQVPCDEHEKALRAALEPWIPPPELNDLAPDPAGVLRTIPEASLRAIKEACKQSVAAKQPFTHVHLLAHGYPVDEGHRKRFGIALHSESGELDPVTPEDLSSALAPLVGHAVVVTLASCDSASATNMTTSRHSVAHVIHVAGFPIVVASQLPLTVAGSNLMARTFYSGLLTGQDVRTVLHQVRVGLYGSQETTGHDWASLVGYVQLPEGYQDHLREVRLQAVLASLGTMQSCSDTLVKQRGTDAARFDWVARQLAERIGELEAFRQEAERGGHREGLQENLGLLGSAEKRLAELCFVRGVLGERDRWSKLVREALQRSRDWYRRGYESNLSAHWNGAQYLSLEAVLEGRIANPRRWHAAVAAAEIDRGRRNPQDAIWACGSLAELWLLAPLAGQIAPADAGRNAVQDMKTRVQQQTDVDTFPLESTERQLRRYVDWWTTVNGFFPNAVDLSVEAGKLIQELRR